MIKRNNFGTGNKGRGGRSIKFKDHKEKVGIEPQSKISKGQTMKQEFSFKSIEVCCTVAPAHIKW